MSAPRPRRARRGQNLLLMAMSLLLVMVMAMMTLSITSRVRQKLEMQTVADVAAYNDAVSTARAMNTVGLLNRAIVSHWVVMLGAQANIAFGSQVPALFDTFAAELEDMRYHKEDGSSPACANGAQETQRLRQLLEARNAFMHASFSLWTKAGPGDTVGVPSCPGCFARMSPGLGELDKQVTDEVKAVRTSVRDLVEVQNDLNKQLLKTLQEQQGARQVVAAALAQPYATSTFPYTVQPGGAEPVGAREVKAAMTTSREAMNPLAHAAMGSRGSLFVIGGAVEKAPNLFSAYTPSRAKQYTTEIRDAMNRLFPNAFHFHVSSNMLASSLTEGETDEDPSLLQNNGSGAGVDDPTEPVGPETTGDVTTGVSDTDPPQAYRPDQVWRMTPSRSVGFDYVGAKEAGTIDIYFHGPCGDDKRDINALSFSRAHADGPSYTASQHEWELGDKVALPGLAPDGSHLYTTATPHLLHGVHRGSQAYDTAGHRLTMLCHPWHRHTSEINDDQHAAGPEVQSLGLMPGGFGFIFPQGHAGPDGAGGAFGQPKLPVLLTRANSGGGITRDPWSLTLNFKFSPRSGGASLDLAKEQADLPMAVLATGIAYYHRRCQTHTAGDGAGSGKPSSCASWMEPPNLLNPFWHATLSPINVDEKMPVDGDWTPGVRRVNEARSMFMASTLPDAAETYRLLMRGGYQGVE